MTHPRGHLFNIDSYREKNFLRKISRYMPLTFGMSLFKSIFYVSFCFAKIIKA